MKKVSVLVVLCGMLGLAINASGVTMWLNSCDNLTSWNGNGTMDLSIQSGGPSGTFLQMQSFTTGSTTSIHPGVTVSAGWKLVFDAIAVDPSSFPDFSVQVHYVDGDKWYMIRDWAWIATPWTHYEYTLPQDGVINVINFNIYSAGFTLGLDNVQFIQVPGNTLQGLVFLGSDFAGDPRQVGVNLEYRNAGTSTVVKTSRVFLDATSGFTDNYAPPAGTYDVAVKCYAHLQKVVYGVDLTSGSATITPAISLTAGDADGDNAVTSTDLSVVLAHMDAFGE